MAWYCTVPRDESDLQATLANNPRQAPVKYILLLYLLCPSGAAEVEQPMERSFNAAPLPYITNLHEISNLPEKSANGDYCKTCLETPYDAGENGNDLVPEKLNKSPMNERGGSWREKKTHWRE
jgi:hypothetical protein